MLLNEMEVFYYVVELTSFSKAASKLGVSKSFISKKITQLERELNTRLLSRSTRKLTLTEAGASFYQHCANVIKEANRAYAMIGALQGKASGRLRISVPPALGMYLLAPLLPDFVRQNPDVQLDLQLENRLVDLIEERYDLVLRVAKLESSNLIAQRISSIPNVICATPAYLRQHGVPALPADLKQHHCAVYSYAKNSGTLKFIRNNKESIVMVNGYLLSNHLDLIKQAVLNNLCVAVLPEFMVTKELKQERLVSCLDGYQLPVDSLYAIYPEREFMPLKVKVFIEMLKKSLAR